MKKIEIVDMKGYGFEEEKKVKVDEWKRIVLD